MLTKPTAETLEYYESEAFLRYLEQVYNLNRTYFVNWIEKEERYDGQMLFLHIKDYIVYHRYDSANVHAWLEAILEEFGEYVVLEWNK